LPTRSERTQYKYGWPASVLGGIVFVPTSIWSLSMPIDPPDGIRVPKWAQVLVSAANARNRVLGSQDLFSIADLRGAWKRCDGRCAVSGLPFNLGVVGDGQAKRPFAPSLDRINRHMPYQRDNVRLVVSIANFAMNAWGETPLLVLASAKHGKYGDRSPQTERAIADSDLDDVAALDTELVETNVGTIAFPPRADMHRPILDLLTVVARTRECPG
jgi:hypothetical protein